MQTIKPAICCIAAALIFFSCKKEILPADGPERNISVLQKKPASASQSNLPNGTYQLVEPGDFDPLWRFTKSGNNMLLQTDPTVTTWGTDYWGYWANPYPLLSNNTVNYIIGLTNTTYAFNIQPGGQVEVIKTLVVNPYLGGEPTTTITMLGTYALQDDDTGGGGGGGTNWISISEENFNDGFTYWQPGGADAGLYIKGKFAHQGREAAYIQDNNGTASAIVQQSFNASAFTTLEISFWFYAVSMENGEYFSLQFDGGDGNWSNIASYTSGIDFVNNRFYNPSITVSSAALNFGTNSRFRIICFASDNKDVVYIDEILVRGK